MCGKTVPMEMVLRDQQVNSLYIQNKLERQSSWALGRCLWSQAEAILGNRVSASRLPDTVRVSCLDSQSSSVELIDRGLAIRHSDGRLDQVFPDGFSFKGPTHRGSHLGPVFYWVLSFVVSFFLKDIVGSPLLASSMINGIL